MTLSSRVKPWVPPILWVWLRRIKHPGEQVFDASVYQVVSVTRPLSRLEDGKFCETHAHFASRDPHLSFDLRVTRLRTYFLCEFGRLALDRTEYGGFLTAGIAFGTAPKVMAASLNFREFARDWYLIDPFDGRGGPTYNLDPLRAQEGLNLGTHAIWIPDALPQALDEVQSSLAFVHLNTGAINAEIESLPRLAELLLPGGFLVMDYYGWTSRDQQHRIDQLLQILGLKSFELPTLQLVAWLPER